jgi:hypothetical protein
MFPKNGASLERLLSRASLNISFGVPSKGALPSVSPHRAPSEGDVPLLEPPPAFIFQKLRYASPLPGSPLNRITNFSFTGYDFYIFPDIPHAVCLTHIHQVKISIVSSPLFRDVTQRRLVVNLPTFRCTLSVPSSRIKLLDCLTLIDGTDKLPRNDDNLTTRQHCVTSQKSEDLILDRT